jgi:SAM-dependent methyltransferase
VKRLPKPVRELLLGLGIGMIVIVNGFRNGGKSRAVKRATRELGYEIFTQLGSRKSSRQFDELRGRKGMKLHLGCGYDVREGWVNVDAFTSLPKLPAENPNTYIIKYDLRQRLPLEDESFELIYSSHFWEHLSFEDGFDLLKDCYRWLQKGGVFRIVLPDFGRVFQAYTTQDRAYFDVLSNAGVMPGRDGLTDGTDLVDFVNYAVYQEGQHKFIYDPAKLTRILKLIGYSEVRTTRFNPEIDIDVPLRTAYSFYLEAVK